jgi:hypothetical protein
MTAFKTTVGDYCNGFQIVFENGYTVSVQFGINNYSDMGATTAEVAAWDPNGEWVRLQDHDDLIIVKGYCSPNDVLGIMNLIANKP